MVVSTCQLHLYQEIYRSSRQLPFFGWCWSECDVTRDSHNGGHCLLTVGGRLRRVKIGGECVKYAWLSCPARPSRWVLCISMQWLTLKGCHVPCDECASGEICSHQHVHVGYRSVIRAVASGVSLKFGVQGASATNWLSRVNGARDTGIRLYSPETPNLGQIRRFLEAATLKFDGWPWKTIGHLFYATSSFVHHFVAIGEFKLQLQSGNAQSGSNSTIFRGVRPWNLTDDHAKQ